MKDRVGAAAAYLATINLSASPTWTYPLKTYPRPTGKATRVIITEYDLPRQETLPHDAAADSHGMIWYGDFGTHMLGMLDPKTGKVTEYPLPITKPGAPLGSLDLVLDKQENIWMGTMYQGSLAKFDRKTKTFQTWGSPDFKNRDEARIAMVMPINADVDGQVWIGGDNEYQVDVKTGEWKTVDYGVGVEGRRARQGAQLVRRGVGFEEQLLRDEPERHLHHQGRREDEEGDAVPDADAECRPAPRPHGRAGSALVRRVPRQQDRDVRHEDREVPGVAGDARRGRTSTTPSPTRPATRGPAA